MTDDKESERRGDDREESGIGSWTDGLTTRERVREIATSLTEARSVEWIRTEADVSSWETTKDELSVLVEFGQIETVEGDDGHTKYAPNYQRRYFDELASLINDHTREELREQVAEIQAEVDEWCDEFGVESRAELESSLTDSDLSSEAIRERNAALRRWERREDDKRLLRHALELYDDARSLHARASHNSNTTRLSQ